MEWPGIEPPPLTVPRKRTPTVLQCKFNHCATEPHKELGDLFTHYFVSEMNSVYTYLRVVTEVMGVFGKSFVRANVNDNVEFVGVFQ